MLGKQNIYGQHKDVRERSEISLGDEEPPAMFLHDNVAGTAITPMPKQHFRTVVVLYEQAKSHTVSI